MSKTLSHELRSYLLDAGDGAYYFYHQGIIMVSVSKKAPPRQCWIKVMELTTGEDVYLCSDICLVVGDFGEPGNKRFYESGDIDPMIDCIVRTSIIKNKIINACNTYRNAKSNNSVLIETEKVRVYIDKSLIVDTMIELMTKYGEYTLSQHSLKFTLKLDTYHTKKLLRRAFHSKDKCLAINHYLKDNVTACLMDYFGIPYSIKDETKLYEQIIIDPYSIYSLNPYQLRILSKTYGYYCDAMNLIGLENLPSELIVRSLHRETKNIIKEFDILLDGETFIFGEIVGKISKCSCCASPPINIGYSDESVVTKIKAIFGLTSVDVTSHLVFYKGFNFGFYKCKPYSFKSLSKSPSIYHSGSIFTCRCYEYKPCLRDHECVAKENVYFDTFLKADICYNVVCFMFNNIKMHIPLSMCNVKQELLDSAKIEYVYEVVTLITIVVDASITADVFIDYFTNRKKVPSCVKVILDSLKA